MRPVSPLRTTSAALATLVAAVTAPLAAQDVALDVAEHEVPKANATIRETVRSAAHAQLLPGGKLLLFVGQKGIARADFDGNTVETLHAIGAEENEVRGASAAFRWNGDSVAMVDPGKGRMMIFAPDGALSRSMPVPRFANIAYAAGGALYGVLPPPRVPPMDPSVAPPRVAYTVARLGRGRGIDTIAQLMPATPVRPNQYGSGTGTLMVFIPMPYQAIDRWFVHDDGTVAIVRGPTYRIDHVGVDGSKTQGTALGYPKVAVVEEEKKAYLKAEKDRLGDLARANQRQPVQAFNWVEPASWPAQHPAMRNDLPIVKGTDDRAWIPVRCASSWKANCYDVVDRSGARVARYRFPEHVTLLAASATLAVSIDRRSDEKGILQRHALP